MRVKWLSKEIAVLAIILFTILFIWTLTNLKSSAAAVSPSKTISTYYTAAKVAAARANIAKYAWAKSERDTAVTNADIYLKPGLTFLWQMITPQSIPRSYAVNQDMGSPVTGKKIDAYGAYPYKIDPVKSPWKITDPSSGYKFPTNDYASYYQSGLDANGVFQKKLADKRYLVNILYPEKGATWGVDDGSGWIDPKGNKYTFIAYYNHWGLWNGYISNAMKYFRDAFVYTGDVKYATAGLVMLDRIADFYPQMDVSAYKWTDGFRNSTGSTDQGKILGSIWETELIRDFIGSYDAFYPATKLSAPPFVTFLSKQGQKYQLGAIKNSATSISHHIEDGIVRQVYPAIQKAQIYGNFGFHQSTLAMAAVVLDEEVTSKQWIDFIFKTGDLANSAGTWKVTGGNLNAVLLDQIDRDGFGDEGSPEYNSYWLTDLKYAADILEGYTRYPSADLYENAKFKKMFSSQIDLIIAGQYTAQIGDSGSMGNSQIFLEPSQMLKAFAKYKNPLFAQAAYFLNGNSLNGLHGDILSANAGNVIADIQTTITQFGGLQLNSANRTGYGFTALRGKAGLLAGMGTPLTPANVEGQRTLWMYYGSNVTEHAHKDSLNIGLDAYGVNIAPDMGYVSYADNNPLRTYWEANTISHNTVVVDQSTQQSVSRVGTPLHFDATERVRLIDVDDSKVYPQTAMYRRTSAMIRIDQNHSYVVDLFRVKGGSEHNFSFHGAEGTVTTTGLALIKQAQGTYAGANIPYASNTYNKAHSSGFNYLQNIQKDSKPTQNFSVDWAAKNNVHLRLTMLGDLTDVALADGAPPQNKPGNPKSLKFLVAHRSGSQLESNFTSVIEPYQGSSLIQTITAVSVKASGQNANPMDARAVKVVMKDGRTDYVFNSLHPEIIYTIDDQIKIQGFFAVVSIRAGKTEYGYLNDGTTLMVNGKTLIGAAIASAQGKIVDFTRKLSDINTITVQMQSNDPNRSWAELVGRTIYIQNDKERNAVYEIKAVRPPTGNLVTLDIGENTLIRGWVDDNDFSKGYKFDIAPGASFQIPLRFVY